jgi:tetratricopeptide (TPR) repeat protein
VICFSIPGRAALPPVQDPLAISAAYYFSHREYAQSYALWTEVLKRQPENVAAMLRVCELKILLESRLACRDLALAFLKERGPALDPESRKVAQDRFRELQSLFISDEGQTAYLQGLTRLERKDVGGALVSLDRAAFLEKGNVKVLKEKAHCERRLQLPELYLQTSKLAYESDPFDPDIVGDLSEAYAYKHQFDKIIAMYKANADTFGSVRNRIAYAVALAETGGESNAVPLLQALVGRGRMMKAPAILWFQLGSSLAQRPDSVDEAINYLEQFLRATTPPVDPAKTPEEWDPYRAVERRPEAEKLLATLRGPK